MEPDWLKKKAEAFLLDRQGCDQNPWINKRACAHCLEALLRDVATVVVKEAARLHLEYVE